ncbi:uncharacterized protein LOC135432196 [Drosophila montana]|uniref:uncharacterized protein LOC135432196 n=1 Tax=Drosophila montana TaxID=40370 RepID=UPI00313E95F6
MYTGLLLSLSVAWILLLLHVDGCAGKRNWEYQPISISARTSDASKLEIEADVQIIGRDYWVISGKLISNTDMNDTIMVEGTGYRSSSGAEDDYKLLPYHIPKQTFKQFADNHYKKIVYKNLKHCSNIPEPENVYPWPKGTYIFKRCIATGDGFPELLLEGYYKINFDITGDVEAGVTIIVLLTNPSRYFG